MTDHDDSKWTGGNHNFSFYGIWNSALMVCRYRLKVQENGYLSGTDYKTHRLIIPGLAIGWGE